MFCTRRASQSLSERLRLFLQAYSIEATNKFEAKIRKPLEIINEPN